MVVRAIVVVILLALLTPQGYAWRGGGEGAFRPEGEREALVGPDGGAVVRGPEGRSVAVLPDGARAVVVNGQTYFLANGVYYQPCFVESAAGFCVVDVTGGDDDNDDNDD